MKRTLLLLILFLTIYRTNSQIIFRDSLKKKECFQFVKISEKEKIDLKKETTDSLIQRLSGFQKNITYSLVYTEKDKTGKTHTKYQLFYKNNILRGAEYVFHSDENGIQFINGFMGSIDIMSKPNFKSDLEAIGAAKLFFTSTYLKSLTNKTEGIVKTVTPIYYYNYATESYEPSFQVFIESKNTEYAEYIFVHAITKKIIGTESLICTANFPGSVQTQYSGQRNIVSDAPTIAGPFRLQETRGANNVLIRTRNNNNNIEFTGITDFFDNDNSWTLAEHVNDRAALDAHWGAETVHDYWLNVHNRNSINNNGMAIESYVHWNVNTFNARWYQNSMQYGDGINGINPLTSIDICSHEFGHGIDQFTGNLSYERESGALDEGFADIWGACIEAWADPTKQRWLMGEDVLGGPIRNMANPNAFGQPDTYLGTNWYSTVGCTPTGGIGGNDYCGVHTNSGVLNFWFYLLSDGGNGTNDIGNAYSVTGIGINDAARIAYKTKLLMNTSLADYPLTREISIQAVREIFGAGSCQEIAVTNAWFAVGVGSAYVNSTLTITGPDLVCNSADYSVVNLPAGSTVIWSIPSGAGSVLQLAQNTPTTNQLRITNMRWYGVSTTLTATITLSCSSVPLTATKVIANDNDNSSTQLGSYYQESCTFYNVSHPTQSGTLNGSAIFLHQGCMTTVSLSNMNGRTVSLSGGGTPLFWSYTPAPNTPYATGTLYLQLPYGSGGVPFIFNITANGACYSKSLVFFAYSNNSRYAFSASPNPVSDVLTITAVENDEATIAKNSKSLRTDVTITANITELNTNQLMLTRKMMSSNKTYQINVSSLRKGYHVLQIIEGDQTHTIKFLKL